MPSPFQRGDNYKIAKILTKLKKFSSPKQLRQFKPILSEGIFVSSNEKTIDYNKVNNAFFLLLINVMILSCVYWFELFSQVSDVAHGPLVFLLGLIQWFLFDYETQICRLKQVPMNCFNLSNFIVVIGLKSVKLVNSFFGLKSVKLLFCYNTY